MLSKTSNKVIAIKNFKHEGYHKVKCISKELGYRNNRGMRRRRCIPEFLLFRGVRLVGGVWVSKSRWHKWPHPILRWTLPKSSVHLPLSESFKAESGAFTTILRHNPQKDWELSSHQQPSRAQRHKSNKLTIFQLPRILGESTNRCTMQWQEHKCSNTSLSNSNTEKMPMENKGGKTK